MKPTEAMLELYQLQTALGMSGYVDHIWAQRGPQWVPKSSSAWPFKRAEPVSNVTKLKRGK